MLDNRIVAQATPDVNVTPQPRSAETLTPEQFDDLYGHICKIATFAGFSAVPWEALGMCDVLNEPTDEPEGLRIYVLDGWPVAVLEYDVGYRLVSGMVTHPWQPN